MQNPRTLYLIDDDSDDLDFFCEAVNSIDRSIICITSNDSEATLKSFKQHDLPIPDLIFLDLNMPLVDGRKFLKEIKSIAPYADVPVVIYSTSSNPRDIEETRQLGATHFLTKPYSLHSLVQHLNDILSNQWSSFALTEK